MKVFIAYGYRDRDRWIERFVFPLVEAFGGTVVTGEKLEGEVIPEGVKREIRRCDGLVGFATRRDAAGDGQFTTHRWVIEELSIAEDHGLDVLEVREAGIDKQRGIVGNRQPIEYREEDREALLVELAGVFGRWSAHAPKQFQLLPGAVADQIRPLLTTPGFTCQYVVLQSGKQQEPEPVDVVPLGGGLFTFMRPPPPDSFVQLRVYGKGLSWRSTFVSVEAIGVELNPDQP